MVEVEVPHWLRGLPLAPEYHPSEAEFLDPIAYILTIEQEASKFGVCKIVPPFVKAPKRAVVNNLNISLACSHEAVTAVTADDWLSPPPMARSMGSARTVTVPVAKSGGVDLEDGRKPKFTTRWQQLGCNSRKSRAFPQFVSQKSVWQSGESYTLDQFEAKAKIFSRNRLGTSKEVAPLSVEALFWKAESEKAISIEYANDIPGSAFGRGPSVMTSCKKRKRKRCVDSEDASDEGLGQVEEEKAKMSEEKHETGTQGEYARGLGFERNSQTRHIDGCKLSNSAWNMRTVARSPGSLLQFMPNEVPGVTSPMVYIGMLFSWFAWHVEDHELHSLNYLHMGASKTWYAVPGEAATALEEVVQVYGYGGELNSRDAFARLGEKTTVMSPEILVAAGVPCCRLVQNAGEYVVTFPRAYHLGFSHGFNCGEAANFATPGWLDVAREAAARRAAMNYLPMLSHQQLLYLLAMSIASRPPLSSPTEVRTSRLKEKKRIGEEIVKTVFVNDVISHNSLLGKLIDHGVTSCLLLSDVCNVTLPAPSLMHSNVIVGCTAMHDFSSKLDPEDQSRTLSPEKKGDPMLEGERGATGGAASYLHDAIVTTPYLDSAASSSGECLDCQDVDGGCSTFKDVVHSPRKDIAEHSPVVTSPFDWGTLPCAVCGILCYAGLAVVEPSQAAALVIKSWKALKVGNHPGNVCAEQKLPAALSRETDTKLDDLHLLPSRGCKPLLDFMQGKPADETAPVNCQEQSVEGGILTPEVPEKELVTEDCNNQCWSLVTPPNVNGESILNQVEVADASFRSSIASTHHEQKGDMVLSDKDASRESASHLKEVDRQNVLCTSHQDASEAVLSVVPVKRESCGKDVGTAALQYKLSVPPSISVGIMERLADEIWSTGDEFVVCKEEPGFNDLSGAVEVCVSYSDPALSSLQHLKAVYSVNCETEDECFEEQKVQESTVICQVQMDLGNVHVPSIGLPSNFLEGYLSCTLPGVDSIGTLNQNTQNISSTFSSNDLVSASETLETSQVTMLKAVDQNDAFLHREDLPSSEPSVYSQRKTVGENMMWHGWKDRALDSDCGLEHQEKHVTVDHMVLVNRGKDTPSHSTNFEGLEIVGKCTVEMDTGLVQNVPVAAGVNGDTEDLCYPRALHLDCFPGSIAQGPICDSLPVESLSSKGPSMEKLEDPAASSISADNGGRDIGSDGSKEAVLHLGECVTCWSTHDDFFYSCDDLTSSSQICPDSNALVSCEEDANCSSFQLSIAHEALSGGGDLAVDTYNTPTFRMGCEAESCTMDTNPLDRDSKHAATFSELHHPLTTQNEKSGVNGGEDTIDVALVLQGINRQYSGASRPRVLCLEHAVDAQRQLEPLGGSHVLVILHSSYAETEQQAKQLAEEMGIEHEWRSVAFEKAAYNDLSTISVALKAEEDNLQGYQDWVMLLGFNDHNTTNAFSSNVDDLNINLGHESIGAAGIKSRVMGKHSKVKKCTVVGQWCGQGWHVDQLHPLLGGCRMVTSQTEVAVLPSVSPCDENMCTPLEVGRSCKVSQCLELAHYDPEQLDVDLDVTKLGRRMETLLGEHSNDEIIRSCRWMTQPLVCNSNSWAGVNAMDDSGKVPVSGCRTTVWKTKLDRGESIEYEAQQALAVWERLGKRKKKDQTATRNPAESSSNYFSETVENKELEWSALVPGSFQQHHDSSQSTGGCVLTSVVQPSSDADGDMSQMSHDHWSQTINPPADVPLLPCGEAEACTVQASAEVSGTPCVLLRSVCDVADVAIPLENAVPSKGVGGLWQTSMVNSNFDTSILHCMEDVILVEPSLGKDEEEDIWHEVPIATVDCLPVSSCFPAQDVDCEIVADKLEVFRPSDVEGGNKTNNLQPCPNDQLCHEVSNCCSVVGGYLQRGAKIQALQRLCRQQCTPVSHSLFAADKIPSLDTLSCNKVSTQKVALCLKRKSTMGGLQSSDKLKLTGASNGEEHVSGHMYSVNHTSNSIPIWLADRGDVKRIFRGDDHGSGDRVFVPVRITFEARQLQGKDVSASNTKVHKWGSIFSCSAGDCIQVFESETLLEAHWSSCHLMIPQSPLDNNNLAATLCTESSFQGVAAEKERKVLWPPSIAGGSLHFDTCVVPRLGRVRGRRTKSLGWKSFIQVSPATLEGKISLNWQGKPSSQVDVQDATYKFAGLKSDACALGVEVGSSMLPSSGCFTGASMRLQRQRPSLTDMHHEGSDARDSPDPGPHKRDRKCEKHRKARKLKANKQCEEQEGEFQCSLEGCCMGFDTERDLQLHMQNRCTWKGCGKHFHLHKYLLQHRRVHLDDRPLKCPWKGCSQSFKWAWARTEHIRVHTGERPYKCTLAGCEQTFRFVSDFSRHKRNTGHKPAS